MTQDLAAHLAALLKRDARFAPGAYEFVAAAVNFTVGRLKERRHVSGRELLQGVRDYAQREYGVLSGTVLAEWGLRSASDVGDVVFLLIGEGILAASPSDDPADFRIDFELAPVLPPPVRRPGNLPKIDASTRRKRSRS